MEFLLCFQTWHGIAYLPLPLPGLWVWVLMLTSSISCIVCGVPVMLSNTIWWHHRCVYQPPSGFLSTCEGIQCRFCRQDWSTCKPPSLQKLQRPRSVSSAGRLLAWRMLWGISWTLYSCWAAHCSYCARQLLHCSERLASNRLTTSGSWLTAAAWTAKMCV